MFFDYREEVEEYEREQVGSINVNEDKKKHTEFRRDYRGEWRRIKRPVYSRFWRAIHNLVAHPMLAIHRPTGQKLHDWTAEKMYEKPSKAAKPISQAD